MPALTDREKRTIRFAAAGLALYLILFFGARVWRHLEQRQTEYQRLQLELTRLAGQFELYRDKALLVRQLKETFQLEPGRLAKGSVVAEASGAIQRAAETGGIQLGPLRESPARASAKELTSMQMEGTGPLPAVMLLLHRLETLGYPLIVDSVQLNPESKPGHVKLNLVIVILDFEQWQQEAPPRA